MPVRCSPKPYSFSPAVPANVAVVETEPARVPGTVGAPNWRPVCFSSTAPSDTRVAVSSDVTGSTSTRRLPLTRPSAPMRVTSVAHAGGPLSMSAISGGSAIGLVVGKICTRTESAAHGDSCTVYG